MKEEVRNIVVGMVTLVVLVFAAGLSFSSSKLDTPTGITIIAEFSQIDGLAVGNEVRMSGIKIGTVTGHRLDPETFDAVVTMTIKPEVKLPNDTMASIVSAGIIVGKYIRLRPGSSKDLLKAGGTIEKTEDFKSLEEQVGEIIFLATDKGGESK
ncbi:MAG: MlaD family protein [Rhodospirillales bacterium]|nr:MlaD family protein [Rhodospirillales bacterium]